MAQWNLIHDERTLGAAYTETPTRSRNEALSLPMKIYSPLAQLRTGHGFMKRTRYVHHSDDQQTQCHCGEQETRDHIILECPLLDLERNEFLIESICGRRNRHTINVSELQQKEVASMAKFIEATKLF